MLDMSVIRSQTERVRAGLAARESKFDLDGLLALDTKRREMIGRCELLRPSATPTEAGGRGEEEGPGRLGGHRATKAVGDEIKSIDAELRPRGAHRRRGHAHSEPPGGGRPRGASRPEQEVRHKAAEERSPSSEDALGAGRGARRPPISRGRRRSPSRHFSLFKRSGARLVRALVNFMLDLTRIPTATRRSARPISSTRVDVRTDSSEVRGGMYKLADDDLFLIPTAEVPVTNMHRDEILKKRPPHPLTRPIRLLAKAGATGRTRAASCASTSSTRSSS